MPLLPTPYAKLVPKLSKFFPADFDIDFNGKSLPWEATCLIPFVDESIFLPHEAEMLENECLAIEESARNIISFTYLSYHSGEEDLGPLRSTLTSFPALPNNYVYSQAHEEYKDVGKHSFESKIH